MLTLEERLAAIKAAEAYPPGNGMKFLALEEADLIDKFDGYESIDDMVEAEVLGVASEVAPVLEAFPKLIEHG